MAILGYRDVMVAMQELQAANRRSEGAQLEAGLTYTGPQARQAIVHGREDIAGLIVVAGMIVAVLRSIRLVCFVIAALLAALLFR